MEKPDTLPSPPSSRPPASHSNWPMARIKPYWDLLAVVLVALAAAPLAWLSPGTLFIVPHPGSFDDNWVLDTGFKASRGIWFGRDVAFPYGPLFEWLSTAPARAMGLSMGAIYATWKNTSLLWFTLLLLYFTLRLLIPEQPAWKRFLLLLLLPVFWTPWDGRTVFAIFLFALFLRGWYAVREWRIKPTPLGCAAAFLCALAFLYSADTGVYAIAAWIITLLGVAWEGRRDRLILRRYAAALSAFAVLSVILVFAINVVMARVFNFRFWKSSLALVSVHRWNEPAQMSDVGKLQLLAALVVGSIILLLRRSVSDDDKPSIAARTGFLLAAFLFAVATMQTGLVRSDSQHILFAIFPMVFFAGVVLFSFRSHLASAVAALAVVGCSLLFTQPAAMFRPGSILFRMDQLQHPFTSCPSGYREFDRACFPAEFAGLAHTVSDYLQQHSTLGDSVVIFPYQYMFGMASGHNVASGVLQSFLAGGPYLSQLDIEGMQQATTPAGLYFPAGPLSVSIDEVSNFTRTPDVWFWIFRHYRSDQQLATGVVGLLKDESRAARISMLPRPLLTPAQTYAIPERSAEVDLGNPAWPVAGGDFLRLRLNVRYPVTWKLRKPESLQLEITHADGSRELKAFVIEPNLSTDVWFYPWSEADLTSYFDADEGHWRTNQRPAITQLRLLFTPLDWVSEKPQSVTVESADAVIFSLGH